MYRPCRLPPRFPSCPVVPQPVAVEAFHPKLYPHALNRIAICSIDTDHRHNAREGLRMSWRQHAGMALQRRCRDYMERQELLLASRTTSDIEREFESG